MYACIIIITNFQFIPCILILKVGHSTNILHQGFAGKYSLDIYLPGEA